MPGAGLGQIAGPDVVADVAPGLFCEEISVSALFHQASAVKNSPQQLQHTLGQYSAEQSYTSDN